MFSKVLSLVTINTTSSSFAFTLAKESSLTYRRPLDDVPKHEGSSQVLLDGDPSIIWPCISSQPFPVLIKQFIDRGNTDPTKDGQADRNFESSSSFQGLETGFTFIFLGLPLSGSHCPSSRPQRSRLRHYRKKPPAGEA
ncbi:hypothetical protein Fot_41907 [Forsythia ovata]|uniref:Uncharacterized protein n=1 Tax=Forsythia ovata TaxID=205694 RepID=A0ABD1RJN3_9LAMI